MVGMVGECYRGLLVYLQLIPSTDNNIANARKSPKPKKSNFDSPSSYSSSPASGGEMIPTCTWISALLIFPPFSIAIE